MSNGAIPSKAGRAVREAQVSEAVSTENWIIPHVIADAYRARGNFEEAVAHQRRAVEMSGGVRS